MLKRVPAYVLIFAIYPSLNLLSANIREVEATVLVRPLLASLLLVGGVFLVLWLKLRDGHRAALATSLFILLFFSYGHVYQALEAHTILGVSLGRHRFLVPLYALIFAAGGWWVIRRFKTSQGVTLTLNAVAIAVLALPGLSLGAAEINRTRSAHAALDLGASLPSLSPKAGAPLRDIYYIILDTYSRQDVILREYGYDNQPFVDRLRQMGFVVAECSRSNYGATHTSLASSLNLAYLPELADRLGKPTLAKDDYSSLIKHSLVRSSLSRLGYRTVAFDTGFEWTRLTDAEIYLGPGLEALDLQRLVPFEALFINTTALLVLTDARQLYQTPAVQLVNFPHQGHIRRQLYILDQLPKLAAIDEPTFTFAHILVPHTPHVFAADGSIETDPGFYSGRGAGAVNADYWRRGYVNEVQFVNGRVLDIVQAILAESSTPPIIVLQGDTGVYPSGDNSGLLSILNAYYLPGDGPQAVYPSITPVNTFRLIFDTYFGTAYGLLPDQSFGGANQAVPIAETSSACLP